MNYKKLTAATDVQCSLIEVYVNFLPKYKKKCFILLCDILSIMKTGFLNCSSISNPVSKQCLENVRKMKKKKRKCNSPPRTLRHLAPPAVCCTLRMSSHTCWWWERMQKLACPGSWPFELQGSYSSLEYTSSLLKYLSSKSTYQNTPAQPPLS